MIRSCRCRFSGETLPALTMMAANLEGLVAVNTRTRVDDGRSCAISRLVDRPGAGSTPAASIGRSEDRLLERAFQRGSDSSEASSSG